MEIGDLSIYPETGEVRNSQGMSVRLSPVNMRILALLASHAGNVVLRNELFEKVWKNQIVSDDALTRCISDIRSELGKLSENSKYIETLPKRGYRWNAGGLGVHQPAEKPQRSQSRHLLAIWCRRGLIYLVAVGLTSSFGTWLISEFAHPTLPVVVLMPAESDPSQRELAASIEQEITEYLLNLDRVDLLSRTAVQSGPANPFPFFYYEFGARWLIESELRLESDESILTIVLVDARAGIVLLQLTERIPNSGELANTNIEQILEQLRDYMNSQQGL